MLDRGDIEVYGPNSKKGVLHRRFFKIQLLYSYEGIFYNYFESTQKKPSVSVTLDTVDDWVQTGL